MQLKNSCAAFASNFNLITSNNYFPAVLLQHVFSFFYFNVCCIFNLSKHVGNVRDMHFIPIRNTKGMSSGCVCVCVCVCRGGVANRHCSPFFLKFVGILTKCVGKISWHNVVDKFGVFYHKKRNAEFYQHLVPQIFTDNDGFWIFRREIHFRFFTSDIIWCF